MDLETRRMRRLCYAKSQVEETTNAKPLRRQRYGLVKNGDPKTNKQTKERRANQCSSKEYGAKRQEVKEGVAIFGQIKTNLHVTSPAMTINGDFISSALKRPKNVQI